MFGFVRPLRGELRVRELERFQSVYCGLCHSIRRRYGLLQTVSHSYDCTFLALVLSALEPGGESCRRRCIVHPFRRRRCACEDAGIRRAAAVSVILTWHKLGDTIADEGPLKRLGARLLRLLLRRGCRKAARDLPDFDEAAQAGLRQLSRLEREQTPSLDRPADAFAQILRTIVPAQSAEVRPLSEMFYHIGRWIYLIDACYDLQEDQKSGNYNPLNLRWDLNGAPLSEEQKGAMQHTLTASLAASYHAYVLLNIQRDQGILENILCQGLPEVTREVLDGTFLNRGGENRHGSL